MAEKKDIIAYASTEYKYFKSNISHTWIVKFDTPEMLEQVQHKVLFPLEDPNLNIEYTVSGSTGEKYKLFITRKLVHKDGHANVKLADFASGSETITLETTDNEVVDRLDLMMGQVPGDLRFNMAYKKMLKFKGTFILSFQYQYTTAQVVPVAP